MVTVMREIHVYTDGSCSTNTGKGGWGLVVVENDKIIHEASGAATDTTNNKMELTAFLEGMKMMDNYGEDCSFTFYTDSSYIANCFRDKWYQNWRANGWRTANRMAVKNQDLWEPILRIHDRSKGRIMICYVKGHADNEFNNRADTLATSWRGL